MGWVQTQTNIKAVKESSLPESEEVVTSFLSMMGYLSKFIPRYFSITAPLRNFPPTMEKPRQLEVTTVSHSIQRNLSNWPRMRNSIIAESRQNMSAATERQRDLWNCLTRHLQGRDCSIAILEMLPGHRLSPHRATGLIAMPVNREVRTKLNYQTEERQEKNSWQGYQQKRCDLQGKDQTE